MKFYIKNLRNGFEIGDTTLNENIDTGANWIEKSNSDYQIILNSNDNDFISSKRFRTKLILFFQNSIAKKLLNEVESRRSEHRHSIGKYITKMDLVIEDLIPLTSKSSIENYTKDVSEVISKNLQNSTKNIIEMHKLVKKLGNEILIMRSLSQNREILSRSPHNLKKAILSIYHLFNNDFRRRKLKINLDDVSNEEIPLSYNHFQGILIQLFDNITKFSRKNSTIFIKSLISKNEVTLLIEMYSLHPEVSDTNKLFEQGFRDISARSTEGSGIGLNTCRRIATKINGSIDFIKGADTLSEKNSIYSKNIFQIKFPY